MNSIRCEVFPAVSLDYVAMKHTVHVELKGDNSCLLVYLGGTRKRATIKLQKSLLESSGFLIHNDFKYVDILLLLVVGTKCDSYTIIKVEVKSFIYYIRIP